MLEQWPLNEKSLSISFLSTSQHTEENVFKDVAQQLHAEESLEHGSELYYGEHVIDDGRFFALYAEAHTTRTFSEMGEYQDDLYDRIVKELGALGLTVTALSQPDDDTYVKTGEGDVVGIVSGMSISGGLGNILRWGINEFPRVDLTKDQ